MLRDNSWLCIQESLLEGSADHMGYRGSNLSWLYARQVLYQFQLHSPSFQPVRNARKSWPCDVFLRLEKIKFRANVGELVQGWVLKNDLFGKTRILVSWTQIPGVFSPLSSEAKRGQSWENSLSEIYDAYMLPDTLLDHPDAFPQILQIEFTCHTIHPHEVHKPMDFSIFTQLYNHHYSFQNISIILQRKFYTGE